MDITNTTREQALKDYQSLCVSDNLNGRAGTRANNFFFFEHRIKTKTPKASGGCLCFDDWINSEAMTKPYIMRVIEYNINRGRSVRNSQYSVYQLYSGAGCQNAFKPAVARWLYKKFKPTRILDFCAGWGGRLLGAMSCNIDYIGIDTNISLIPAYDNMIAAYPHTNNITMMFQDSSTVDYSQFEYDMVLTSPPYYKKTAPTEIYEHMTVYSTRNEYNERFLFPVIRATFNHLKEGGIYCLNIPVEQYAEVVPILGECSEAIEYPLTKRSTKKGHGGSYKEYIYCWRK